MKKIRVTESELKDIIKKIVLEQDEDPNHEFIRGIQRFLNETLKPSPNLTVDGLTDHNLKSNTAKAIARYQSKIGVYPTDGVWGDDTWSKMPQMEKEKLKDLIAEEGGVISQFLNWIGL